MESIATTDPVPLYEVLGDREQIRIGRLIKIAKRHDIVIGEHLDEELLLCGEDPDPEEEPDPHWMPYLARMDAPSRIVAVETTARHLDSLGAVELGDTPGEVYLLPPHSLIAHAFRSAVAAVTWRVQSRGEADASGSALLMPGGLVLHDDIDRDMGQHVLVLRSAEREASHVASWIDPKATTRQTEPAIVAASPEELQPSPSELAARARTSTIVARVARTPGGGTESAVTAYGTDEGLWLLQGRKGAEPVATLQLVGEADLFALTKRLTSLKG